jgi:hypothetical protein
MRSIIVVAALAAAGACAPASAQDAGGPSYSGLYGNLGWAGRDTHDALTNSITGRVGWRFSRFLGVEGEVSGGMNTDHYTFAPGTAGQTSVGVKQSLAGAGYVVGFVPIAPNFDVLGRIGYGASHYDVSPNGFSAYHVSENGVRLGAGAQYFFDGRNGVRADYTWEDMNDVHDAPGFFAGGRHANVYAVTFAHKF